MNSLFPMTRVFDNAFNTRSPHSSGNNEGSTQSKVTPRADILESDGEFRILIDLPGVAGSDLDISVEDQTLTVKAGRRTEVPEGFETRRHERFSQVDYVRSFTLGNAIDTDGIGAGFSDGVLSLSLPKSTKSMARRIEVK